jgi:AcrR family transcriptional regulator
MQAPAPIPETSRRKRRASPRQPSRGRGLARYAALLDAAHDLLKREAPDAIGLYQIAERAGVPPASAYHFFPTKEAAYVGLAERYCDEIVRIHSVPIPARDIANWQDVFRIDLRRAMAYFNSEPSAMKILYGGYGGVEARNIDKIFSRKLAQANYSRLDKIFHMPVMRDAEKKFELRLAILDSIWEVSVRRHGHITEDYFTEALDACNAYIRLFLPEHLEPREILVRAMERDAVVHLHLPGDQIEISPRDIELEHWNGDDGPSPPPPFAYS